MKWLITGGAGFIGCNTAHVLLQAGHQVTLVDNLSRAGSESNLAWLHSNHPDLDFQRVDIRDYDALRTTIAQHRDADVVLHLAAQVAVTTSVKNPREDFEINALGSLNLLESLRTLDLNPVTIFASTNKVYGNMDMVEVVEHETRYGYAGLPDGNPESTPIDFHSPYGCSKGTADQYFHDYYRIYGLRTVVFRNSCIYGTRQFGVEDQGWVAWFTIAALTGKQITIYGDGKQVRDILFIDDLVRAFVLAAENIDRTQGGIFNIGGGMQNTMSVWCEFAPILEKLHGKPIPALAGDWRPGDQKVYISNIGKAQASFGWQPQVGLEEGIARLYHWVADNRHLFVR
jgi:CDP-paratose 2-epimerase